MNINRLMNEWVSIYNGLDKRTRAAKDARKSIIKLFPYYTKASYRQ